MRVAQSSVLPIYKVLRTLTVQAAQSAPHPSDKAVHDMRRNLKRIRAALRLLSGCLGDKFYRENNGRVRDAGRPLAPVRDAAVMLRTARRLPAREYSNVERHYLAALVPHLELERRAAKRRLTAAALNEGAALLSEILKRLGSRRAPTSDQAAVIDGIRTTYRACRKAWHRAQRRPDDDRLHVWRKQVTCLANQLDLVQEAFQLESGKLHRRAQKLADCLGKDHDLAVFTAKLDAVHLQNGSPADKGYRRLQQRLRAARRRLQRKAWRRGKKLLSGSAREFVRDLGAPSDTIGNF